MIYFQSTIEVKAIVFICQVNWVFRQITTGFNNMIITALLTI